MITIDQRDTKQILHEIVDRDEWDREQFFALADRLRNGGKLTQLVASQVLVDNRSAAHKAIDLMPNRRLSWFGKLIVIPLIPVVIVVLIVVLPFRWIFNGK